MLVVSVSRYPWGFLFFRARVPSFSGGFLDSFLRQGGSVLVLLSLVPCSITVSLVNSGCRCLLVGVFHYSGSERREGQLEVSIETVSSAVFSMLSGSNVRSYVSSGVGNVYPSLHFFTLDDSCLSGSGLQMVFPGGIFEASKQLNNVLFRTLGWMSFARSSLSSSLQEVLGTVCLRCFPCFFRISSVTISRHSRCGSAVYLSSVNFSSFP